MKKKLEIFAGLLLSLVLIGATPVTVFAESNLERTLILSNASSTDVDDEAAEAEEATPVVFANLVRTKNGRNVVSEAVAAEDGFITLTANFLLSENEFVAGWKDETGRLYKNGERVAIERTTSFFAIISERFWVAFETGEGATAIDPVSVIKAGVVARPMAPTREGFEFVGWRNKETGESFDFSTLIRKNITLVAEWREIVVETVETVSMENVPANNNVASNVVAASTAILNLGSSAVDAIAKVESGNGVAKLAVATSGGASGATSAETNENASSLANFKSELKIWYNTIIYGKKVQRESLDAGQSRAMLGRGSPKGMLRFTRRS